MKRTKIDLGSLATSLPGVERHEEMRRLTGAELRERLQELFGTVHVESLPGHRLAVAWRIARALAAAQGHIRQGGSLAAIPETAWQEHIPGRIQGRAIGAPPWLVEVASAGVPLRPIEGREADYADVACEIAFRLGMERIREERVALTSLLSDPLAWPERWEIIDMEQAVVRETFDVATRTPELEKGDPDSASEAKARRMLRDDFRLTHEESESVMSLVRAFAVEQLPDSQEVMRALQYHALEDCARRAAQTLDLRAEASFRRLIAQVSGVTRTEPESLTAMMINTVRQISARHEQEEARSPLASGRPEAILIPAKVDEEEAEALAELDDEAGGINRADLDA